MNPRYLNFLPAFSKTVQNPAYNTSKHRNSQLNPWKVPNFHTDGSHSHKIFQFQVKHLVAKIKPKSIKGQRKSILCNLDCQDGKRYDLCNGVPGL